jgi:hypothetical protein
MNENEMGNRGSKSDLNFYNKSQSVKEQRVDGSWATFKNQNQNKKVPLRCTLTGC